MTRPKLLQKLLRFSRFVAENGGIVGPFCTLQASHEPEFWTPFPLPCVCLHLLIVSELRGPHDMCTHSLDLVCKSSFTFAALDEEYQSGLPCSQVLRAAQRTRVFY